MSLIHTMRITHDVLVATINEGLANRHLRLDEDRKRVIDLDPDDFAASSASPVCRFSFIHAETEMHATLSYDEKGGVVITVVLIGTDHSKSECAGVAVGRLHPAWPGEDPGVLALQCGAFCCDGIISHRIFAMKHEVPKGYSLRVQ